jgi:hypothetical protein
VSTVGSANVRFGPTYGRNISLRCLSKICHAGVDPCRFFRSSRRNFTTFLTMRIFSCTTLCTCKATTASTGAAQRECSAVLGLAQKELQPTG